MLERTICELYSSCGDPHGRFRGCQFESMPREIRSAVVDAVGGIMMKYVPVIAIVVIPLLLHWIWNWVVLSSLRIET